MKLTYAKCVLYAYANINRIIEDIDEIVLSKALASMEDISPCIEQCENILAYTDQKQRLLFLKAVMDKILEKCSPKEKAIFEYKYCRKRSKDYKAMFDCRQRSYYRKQIKLVTDFAFKLEKKGITDKFFEEELQPMTFFDTMLKFVVQKDKKDYKRKRKSCNPVSIKERLTA